MRHHSIRIDGGMGYSLEGGSLENPDGCGFGKVGEVPQETVGVWLAAWEEFEDRVFDD